MGAKIRAESRNATGKKMCQKEFEGEDLRRPKSDGRTAVL